MFGYPAQVIIGDISPYTQAIAILNQTVFGTNWTANASSDVIVYQTPFGSPPNDATQILMQSQYTVAFIGSQEEVQVTLVTPASAGDIITITRQTPASRENLYTNTNFTPTMLNNDFGILTLVDQQAQLVNQLIGPRYNYSAIIQDIIDTILPILPPGYIWMKNTNNTAIIAVPVPGGSVPGGGFINPGLINQLAFYAANGTTLSGLPTGNNGVLVTSNTGVPSISSTLPSGLTIPNIRGALTISDLQTIYDANGNVVLSLGAQPNAVNTFGVVNNGTGMPPVIGAFGADTNINLVVQGKGTGGVLIHGFTDGNSVPAGYVGEVKTSNVPFASAISLTTGTVTNIASLSLTAGNWLVFGVVFIAFSVAGNSTSSWISTVSATEPDFSMLSVITLASGTLTNTGQASLPITLNLDSPIIVYLQGGGIFPSGTGTACGTITAIRIS